MQALVSCPDRSGPAEITESFRLPSTDGPVDHIALSCAADDRLSQQVVQCLPQCLVA